MALGLAVLLFLASAIVLIARLQESVLGRLVREPYLWTLGIMVLSGLLVGFFSFHAFPSSPLATRTIDNLEPSPAGLAGPWHSVFTPGLFHMSLHYREDLSPGKKVALGVLLLVGVLCIGQFSAVAVTSLVALLMGGPSVAKLSLDSWWELGPLSFPATLAGALVFVGYGWNVVLRLLRRRHGPRIVVTPRDRQPDVDR